MKDILLIQTGGTIAMDTGNSQKPKLDASKWSDLISHTLPDLSGIARVETKTLFLEDSSDINKTHWIKLAGYISQKYHQYDGFVILHGTDTMAYTASALSFAIQNIDKPVILTGSQVPMSSVRSDARRNLINSIEMATTGLPEVAICFNDFVYRGNRTTKISIGDFDAFASPNHPPLAEIGLHIEMLQQNIRQTSGQVQLASHFSEAVFLLKIYPSLDPTFLFNLPLDNTRALVVEAFGSGNFPIRGEQSLLPFFEQCLADGIILIITSQAAYDAVDLSNYESGRKALELGIIGAGDMTTEATLTKIMYLMGTYTDKDTVSKKFKQNLAGEVT